jgi:hypothetical protein
MFDLVRDVLDKPLVDRDDTLMGRVDGIVLEWTPDAPPHVRYLESGFVVLARRLGARMERLVIAIRERWSIRETARYQIPWTKVLDLQPRELKIAVQAEETPAFAWERWLRDRIIKRIPGAGFDE